MHLSPLRLNLLQVADEEGPSLGIGTGVPARGFAAQRVSAAARAGGTLVADGRFIPWPVSRMVDYDGTIYLVGPIHEGTTIMELLQGSPVDDPAWLVSFLAGVAAAVRLPDLVLCNGITSLVCPDGAVLFLDRELATVINANLPLPDRKVAHFPYRSARLVGADFEMYQALAIAYHALAGHTVCPADDPDRVAECHGDPRRHVPLHAHRPELNPRICGLVEEGLASAAGRTPEHLERLATLLRDEPLFDTQDPAILEARAAAATESRERAETTTRRRTFLRHHGKTIAITALIIAAVLTVPVSILRGALRPPATEGMDARTVAETYYRAWNDLDHVLLEDTLARGVGRDTLREVTNVFVIDRVQTAQSWRSMLIEADEWLEAGRPGGRMPYGISDLEVELASLGADEAVVRAEYSIWRPSGGERPDGTPETTAVRTDAIDRLTLTRTPRAWEITEIETTILDVEEVTIPADPGVQPAADPAAKPLSD
jgi:hypothetical protein